MNKWAADPAENQTQEHHLPSGLHDFPRDRLNDNKGGVGRWAAGEEEEKNEYLASTERTFQLKNSRLLCKSILTLERGKLKEKA